jgi:hypothetical protein
MDTELEIILEQIRACRKKIHSCRTGLYRRQKKNADLEAANRMSRKEAKTLNDRLRSRKYVKNGQRQQNIGRHLHECKLTGEKLQAKIERCKLENEELQQRLPGMLQSLNLYFSGTELKIMSALNERQWAIIDSARSNHMNNCKYPDIIALLTVELYTQCGGNVFRTIETLKILNEFFNWKMTEVPSCNVVYQWVKNGTKSSNQQNRNE